MVFEVLDVGVGLIAVVNLKVTLLVIIITINVTTEFTTAIRPTTTINTTKC